jgi:hypothetical protein
MACKCMRRLEASFGLVDHRGCEEKLVLTAKCAPGAIRHLRKFARCGSTPRLTHPV